MAVSRTPSTGSIPWAESTSRSDEGGGTGIASSFDICSVRRVAELQDLVDALARRLGGPVSIDDRRYRVLAYSAHAEPPDALRLTSILTRAVPAAVAAWLDERGLPDAEAPVRLPANPGLGMGPRVAVPIRGDGLLGFLWLFDEAVSDEALAAATASAAAAAPALTRLRAAERSDHALVGDLLRGDRAARDRAAAALRERGLHGRVHVLAGPGLDALRLPRHRLAAGAGAALLIGGEAELDALDAAAGGVAPDPAAVGVSGASRAARGGARGARRGGARALARDRARPARRALGPARRLPAARAARRHAAARAAAAAARAPRRRAAHRHAGGLPRPRRGRARRGRGAVHPPHEPVPPPAPDRGDHGRQPARRRRPPAAAHRPAGPAAPRTTLISCASPDC